MTARRFAVILLVCAAALVSQVVYNVAHASECPTYSPEQTQVLRKAWEVGLPHDRQHSLVAIVERGSFVGPYVIRVTSTDGAYGGYSDPDMFRPIQKTARERAVDEAVKVFGDNPETRANLGNLYDHGLLREKP